MELFESILKQGHIQQPIAEELRPKTLAEYVGQEKSLRGLKPFLDVSQPLPNLLLWGPPGTGKTTLALLLAKGRNAKVHILNAVDTGAKQIRELGQEAHIRRLSEGLSTIIFIDEIHRLNRSQQDVLLPFTENGDLTLIGATTENPSYELNSALLSRSRVVVLERLTDSSLRKILEQAWSHFNLKGSEVLDELAQNALIEWADGDARKLLNAAQVAVEFWRSQCMGDSLNLEVLSEALQAKSILYDKKGSEHYDVISAFIKSIRGSDPDAGIYYLARMLEGGEDPVFIARRLVVLASEDVGNADPRALSVAVAGLQAVELVGMPEARINLAQVVTYLASAPKSNASYVAINEAMAKVKQTGALPVPLALRSARTKLSKDLGYGQGYEYAHSGERGWKDMTFLPEKMEGQQFYLPVDRGFEKTIREYLAWVKRKT